MVRGGLARRRLGVGGPYFAEPPKGIHPRLHRKRPVRVNSCSSVVELWVGRLSPAHASCAPLGGHSRLAQLPPVLDRYEWRERRNELWRGREGRWGRYASHGIRVDPFDRLAAPSEAQRAKAGLPAVGLAEAGGPTGIRTQTQRFGCGYKVLPTRAANPSVLAAFCSLS
jgi:hypothetical protein